jgi:hypothetical protein
MNDRRRRIEYGFSAQRDLESLPVKIRKQILRKITDWNWVYVATLSGCIAPMPHTDYGWAIIESCSMWKVTFIVIRRIGDRKQIYD